ncbi:MAG: hypothetical protein HGA85_09110, partial [Nanoarchaeota archaeon]|nr:hypothetical protein [Nanoarchaeota archaeon]
MDYIRTFPSPIAYSAETERFYRDIHNKGLDFLEQKVLNPVVPTYVETYADYRVSGNYRLESAPGSTWLATSNREPTEVTEKWLWDFPGDTAWYDGKIHSVLVDTVYTGDRSGDALHETAHAIVGTLNVRITTPFSGVPRTFGEAAGIYRD